MENDSTKKQSEAEITHLAEIAGRLQARSAAAAAIASDMPRIVRHDATTLAGMAARYQHRLGAEQVVMALLEARTQLLLLDPTTLLDAENANTQFVGEGEAPHADRDRLRVRATDPAGALLSELLVHGGFVRNEQSARQGFRMKQVTVNGALVGVDMRLPPGVAKIKVGDQDEREVEIVA